MSERKFYRTVVTIEVLSEAPLQGDIDLADVAYQIDEGDWVGNAMKLNGKEITANEAVDALYEFGSEPGFFGLKADGSDDEEEEGEE